MLDTFIISNRDTIVAQAKARVAERTGLASSVLDAMSGIPVFLDQLGDALRLAKSTAAIDHERIGTSAAQHGLDLLHRGLTIDQVVHDYGDVCQVVSELAIEQDMMISGSEFKTLNLCLDDAIAGAVMSFSQRREHDAREQGTGRLHALARELRSLLNTATLAFESVSTGRVALRGSTGQLHTRSLVGMRDLLDGLLAEVRLDAGLETFEKISVAELIEEVRIGVSAQAQERSVLLDVPHVEPVVTVEGDRQVLIAAVSNLLQNACKFTHPNTIVRVSVATSADSVLIDIEDQCGGIDPDLVAQLDRTFAEDTDDRSTMGRGLALCLRAAKANGGGLRVRNVANEGCVFTLVLPKKPAPPLLVHGGGKPVARS